MQRQYAVCVIHHKVMHSRPVHLVAYKVTNADKVALFHLLNSVGVECNDVTADTNLHAKVFGQR